MTEERFKTLLTTALAEQEERLVLRLKERIVQKLDQRIGQRLTEAFEINNAVLFGQFTQYFDARLKSELDPMKQRIDELYVMLDGLAKRMHNDERERAILVVEQRRHRTWIKQLARSSNTKLSPSR